MQSWASVGQGGDERMKHINERLFVLDTLWLK